MGYAQGMGMGSSPAPMGQIQAQQTGFLQSSSPANGPRGPYAPVPANQGLLNPLIPTNTGFTGFVPTSSPATGSPFQGGQQSSFLQAQPTGFMGQQPQQPMMNQTGFGGPPLMAQPTGFQPSGSLMAQPTGIPSQGFSSPMSAPLMSQPTGFGNGPSFQPGGMGFNGVQTNPTGFNPGFGQFNPGVVSPPPAPTPQKDVSPANVFAQMKSGTFGSDAAPQSSDKYDALRPQPTGWGMQNTGFQTGYGQFGR
jgi:hypothetical protein